MLFERRAATFHAMIRVLIATSNPGKLRDFAGAAAPLGIAIESLPNFAAIPTAVEDGLTFEANARKKAEYYSAFAPGEIVLADDSGLEVDAWAALPAFTPPAMPPTSLIWWEITPTTRPTMRA